MELKPRGRQRWAALIGKGTAHGATLAPPHLGLGVCAPFQVPFERPHTPHAFFQHFLGMALGLIAGLRGFTPIMELTPLVRHTRQGLRHSRADGGLAVADAPPNRHVERLLYRESGLLGMSGISSDMRDLTASEDPAARLAVDVFVYRAGR